MDCPAGPAPMTLPPVLLSMQIAGGTTAILSILGAILIIFTYAAFKNLRTTARQLLVNLSVADIVVSGSHFTGILVKYENHFSVNGDENFNSTIISALCSTQGAFTVFGTVASFLWSMFIAVYMLVLTQSRTAKPRKILVPIVYVLSWGIPIVVVIVMASMDNLGYNPEDSPVWCYTKIFSSSQGNDALQNALDYDLWLFLTYFLLFLFYALIYCSIRCPCCRHRSRPGIKAAKGDIKLLFVPVIFLLLRIWSSLIDVAVHFSHSEWKKNFLCSDAAAVFIVLAVIGANGQGLANAILFCGFTKKVRRKLVESCWSLWTKFRETVCCFTSKLGPSRTGYDKMESSSDYEDDNLNSEDGYYFSEAGAKDNLSLTNSVGDIQSHT